LVAGFYIGFLEVTWVDSVDILLVSYLIYQLYKLIRGSVAFRIALGVLAIYMVYMVVKAFHMELLTAILGQFIGVGVLAALILFQPEIRRFLLLVGKTTFGKNDGFLKGLFKRRQSEMNLNVREVVDTSKALSGTNTGALIVLSRQNDLHNLAQSGDAIDAILSRRLLISIFNKYSPLHDGAVLVRDNRIIAARCILPVSERNDLPAQFGLRHRAALGITEATDAVVLIVSEETGQVSIAHDGKIDHNLSPVEIRNLLNQYLNMPVNVGGQESGQVRAMPAVELAPGKKMR
jgi:uncharacterized protein (TIGR00159 family)